MIVSLLLILVCIFALAAAAFCAGAETAFMSVSRGRITHLAREGSRTARIVQSALREMNRTLTSLLIGNNLAHVLFSSAAAALGARLCGGNGTVRGFWTILSAFTVLYLSEFLPKLFCSMRPLTRSLSLARTFQAFSRAFSPLTNVAMVITNLFVPRKETKEKVTSGELLRILSDRKDGVKLTDFESALIARILVLRHRGEFITTQSLLSVLDDDDSL